MLRTLTRELVEGPWEIPHRSFQEILSKFPATHPARILPQRSCPEFVESLSKESCAEATILMNILQAVSRKRARSQPLFRKPRASLQQAVAEMKRRICEAAPAHSNTSTSPSWPETRESRNACVCVHFLLDWLALGCRQPRSQAAKQSTAPPSSPATKKPSSQEPSNQARKQPRNPATQQPSNQATKQPSNQATKQPSNQATKQPSTQAPKHPSDKATRKSQATSQAAKQPSNQATKHASDEATRKPGNKPSSQAAKQPSSQVAK